MLRQEMFMPENSGVEITATDLPDLVSDALGTNLFDMAPGSGSSGGGTGGNGGGCAGGSCSGNGGSCAGCTGGGGGGGSGRG